MLFRSNRFISKVTGLALRRWEGEFQGITAPWLRWETLEGVLLPLKGELAERESARAKRLAAKLRALGINPDDVGE